MGGEPAQDRGDLRRLLMRVLLGQVENVTAGERGEARVQRRRIAGAREQERRIVGRMRESIFDRKSRLADSAKPGEGHPGRRLARKHRAQGVERLRAADE